MEPYIVLFVIFALLFMLAGTLDERKQKKIRKEKTEQNSKSINRWANQFLEDGLRPIDSKIRCKRNEYMLADARFDLYRYKSSGRVAGHGFRFRTKIAEGLTYTAGAGRLYSEKDWCHDGSGIVTISNQAIIYSSATNTKRFTWSSIAKLEICANGFILSPSRGAVLQFECENPRVNHHKVLALLFLEDELPGGLASARATIIKDSDAEDADFDDDENFSQTEPETPPEPQTASDTSSQADKKNTTAGTRWPKSTKRADKRATTLSSEERKEKAKVEKRLKLWAKKQHQINAQILNAFLEMEREGYHPITVSMLRNKLYDMPTFQQNFDSMKAIAPRNHGKIFEVEGEVVTIWSVVEEHVREYERTVFHESTN